MALKSKYAPVMPIRLFQALLEHQLKHDTEDVIGDYFLLLAHDVLAYPDEYAEIFQNRDLVPKDSFVILDNSVIELGKPLDVDSLLLAAKVVQPNCIILPDVLGNMLQSVDMVRKAHNNIILNTDAPIEMMAVLQGQNIAELTRCAVMYAEFEHIQYYGCPRWVANKLGTRKVFETVLGIQHPIAKPIVHMLGMSQHAKDDVSCTQLPGVMGIDSANPCVLGQIGMPLKMDTYQHAPRTARNFDYWRGTKLNPMTINNILTMRRWVGGCR